MLIFTCFWTQRVLRSSVFLSPCWLHFKILFSLFLSNVREAYWWDLAAMSMDEESQVKAKTSLDQSHRDTVQMYLEQMAIALCRFGFWVSCLLVALLGLVHLKLFFGRRCMIYVCFTWMLSEVFFTDLKHGGLRCHVVRFFVSKRLNPSCCL